ncbi:hypothetical protein EJ377_16765 [Chryseobacterium arthrosphaerae]|uniref:Uncharacterized protein n=1 Tax=Chryseobacterium arthrosphaerae TaxID=651561 RepID=A0A432DSP0_9FLAO|nr:hypothetical protein EJ377_16765 [Chryseobacterium arthrosphaerae]
MNYLQTFFPGNFLGNHTHYYSGYCQPVVLFRNYTTSRLAGSYGFWFIRIAKNCHSRINQGTENSTELFISIAVIVSVVGKEYLAGSVVLMIILIAEYIASASGERARASIKELIGSVPQTAILKKDGNEQPVSIASLTW